MVMWENIHMAREVNRELCHCAKINAPGNRFLESE